jgi:protein required for attachment to host cells
MNIRIVVANENSANIYDTARPNAPLASVGFLSNPMARLADRELESDRPGRGAGGMAGGRHGVTGERSARRHATELFVKDVAQTIDLQRKRHEFDRLVLVAGPRMLGMLREALPDQSRLMIAAEVGKDLTQHHSNDIIGAIPKETFWH